MSKSPLETTALLERLAFQHVPNLNWCNQMLTHLVTPSATGIALCWQDCDGINRPYPMDSLLTALLTAATSLVGCAVAVRLCLGGIDRRPAFPLVHTPAASAWAGLIPKDWPEDRELHLVHSEQVVEGTGRFQRQVTRVTQCTVKAREAAQLDPVQWLPADAGQPSQRDRLRRAYEVHDVPARWKPAESPRTATTQTRHPALTVPRTQRVHWLA